MIQAHAEIHQIFFFWRLGLCRKQILLWYLSQFLAICSMSIWDNLTGSPQKWGSFAALASPWASRTGTACSCFTYPATFSRGKSPVAMEVLRGKSLRNMAFFHGKRNCKWRFSRKPRLSIRGYPQKQGNEIHNSLLMQLRKIGMWQITQLVNQPVSGLHVLALRKSKKNLEGL